jgi:hypothetical protein
MTGFRYRIEYLGPAHTRLLDNTDSTPACKHQRQTPARSGRGQGVARFPRLRVTN